MRVLVTGGTGYLGRSIVAALAARGHEPVVFARSARASALPGTLVDGDVRDESAVGRAADGCAAICHTAALVSMWRARRQDFDDVNVGGLRNVLRAARARRISGIIYTSSFLALPPAGRAEPQTANDYQRTKVEARRVAERAAQEGAPIVSLYPGVLYGPGVATEGNLVGRLVADHLAGRLPGVIGADRIWSFAFVNDVAAGHVAALERGQPGGHYLLGGENLPQIRAFEIVRDLTGRPLPRRLPHAVAWAIGLVEEARSWLLRRPPLVTRGAVAILEQDWPLDSTRAVAELGYRMTPLADGLRRLVQAAP